MPPYISRSYCLINFENFSLLLNFWKSTFLNIPKNLIILIFRMNRILLRSLPRRAVFLRPLAQSSRALSAEEPKVSYFLYVPILILNVIIRLNTNFKLKPRSFLISLPKVYTRKLKFSSENSSQTRQMLLTKENLKLCKLEKNTQVIIVEHFQDIKAK